MMNYYSFFLWFVLYTKQRFQIKKCHFSEFKQFMRKRIIKEKEQKCVKEQKIWMKHEEYVDALYPFKTLQILHGRTMCLGQVRQLEKERISNIIRGRNLQSVNFQQIQKNCCFEEFMKRYYTFKETTLVFTELVKKNSLTQNLTFVDFKLKNYKIMNNYCKLMKNINLDKDKNISKITASCSVVKEPKSFKELESEVKKITKKSVHIFNKKQSQSNSHSYTNFLVKNIEKMLKNFKDNTILPKKQNIISKTIKKPHQKTLKNTKSGFQQRLNTTPQNFQIDNYGLDEFRQKKEHKKSICSSSMMQANVNRLLTLTIDRECNIRHQTQYDTQKICTRKLSKIKQESSKQKSLTKFKSLSFKKKSIILSCSKGKGQKLLKK